jgi:SnoaL-like domain
MSRENVERPEISSRPITGVTSTPPLSPLIPRSSGCFPSARARTPAGGPDEVKRFWNGLDETFEELRLIPQEFVDAGDHVATRLRHYGRGKRSGIEIDEEMYHQVATFRGGRMVRIEYFGEWSEALEAAGLSEGAA